MSSPDAPFYPAAGQTQTISATTTSSSVTVSATVGCERAAIINLGPSTAYIRIGKIGVATTASITTDMPIVAGAGIVCAVSPSGLVVAAITATGTASVAVSPGTGN